MRLKSARLAVASLIISAALLVSSDTGLAAGPAVADACQVSCSRGSCSAASSIWQFWEDCTCSCTPEGWGRCGCD